VAFSRRGFLISWAQAIAGFLGTGLGMAFLEALERGAVGFSVPPASRRAGFELLNDSHAPVNLMLHPKKAGLELAHVFGHGAN
jgi:hypothetical protein